MGVPQEVGERVAGRVLKRTAKDGPERPVGGSERPGPFSEENYAWGLVKW